MPQYTPERSRASVKRPALLGVDFTSAPGARKAITVAHGALGRTRLRLRGLERLRDWAAFEALLARPGPWLGAFDFPFGLPRAAVEALDWPRTWPALVRHAGAMDRTALRARFDALRAARPPGNKYPHRATDRPAGSSSPIKLVHPPVALMFHAGAPRLLAAGVHLPGLHAGDTQRVALEGYPGLLARVLVRGSYKADAPARQDAPRRAARARMVEALRDGGALGITLTCTAAQATALVDDASGDALDAVLCALQAAWAQQRRERNFGLPDDVDPIEGWIVGA